MFLHCKSNTFNFKKQYFYFTTIMFYHKKAIERWNNSFALSLKI